MAANSQESYSNSERSNSDDDKESCEEERFVGSIKFLPSKQGRGNFVFEVKRKSSIQYENEQSKTKPSSPTNQKIQNTQEVSRVTSLVQSKKASNNKISAKQIQLVAKSEPITSTFTNNAKLASFDSAPQLSTMQTPEWGGNISESHNKKVECNNIQSSIKKLQLIAKNNKINENQKTTQAQKATSKKLEENNEV